MRRQAEAKLTTDHGRLFCVDCCQYVVVGRAVCIVLANVRPAHGLIPVYYKGRGHRYFAGGIVYAIGIDGSVLLVGKDPKRQVQFVCELPALVGRVDADGEHFSPGGFEFFVIGSQTG